MSKAILEKKLYLAKESPEPIFDLSDCSLKQVPNGIFAVIKVYRKEFLYLQNNKLSSLKEGGNLRDLSLLKALDISSNRIAKLPTDIQYLTSLKILKIDNNEITVLSREIGNLVNLEQLTLSSNKLKTLPDSIGNLKKLQHLDIRNNSNLNTLPTLHRNKCLKELLLDGENNWKNPPREIIRNGIEAILSYFYKENGIVVEECDTVQEPEQETSKIDDVLSQLSLHDKYVQDNLRRLEKEKEEKLMQTIITERKILKHKENELLLHKENQNRKDRLLDDLLTEQRKLDDEVYKFQKQKQKDQDEFICQLLSVESTVDEVIKQLLKINASHSERHVRSLASSLLDELPTKEPLHCQQILESMEKLLAQEYLLDRKFQEYNTSKCNLIEVSNSRETKINDKIDDLLSKRQNDQERLLNEIKQDSDLQYAAVLMLIEKTDNQNVELQNQISLIENQLSNLTVLELNNKALHLDKHVNELSVKRAALSALLLDLFARQQAYREQLIEELKEAEKTHAFKSNNEYWLIQYQRLLNCVTGSVPKALYSLPPNLIYELALFGVSHCAPFLSMFDTKSTEDLSKINDESLKKVGIHSREDRDGILEAIRHFTEQYCSTITPTAPSLDDVKKPESPDCSSISSDTLRHDVASVTPASPSAPTISDIANSPTSGLQHSVLVNECVVCFEDQSNIIFLSCGHICCCANCSVSLNTCPLCRCDIERKLHLYTP